MRPESFHEKCENEIKLYETSTQTIGLLTVCVCERSPSVPSRGGRELTESVCVCVCVVFVFVVDWIAQSPLTRPCSSGLVSGHSTPVSGATHGVLGSVLPHGGDLLEVLLGMLGAAGTGRRPRSSDTHPMVALFAGLLLVGLELGELNLHELVAACQLCSYGDGELGIALGTAEAGSGIGPGAAITQAAASSQRSRSSTH